MTLREVCCRGVAPPNRPPGTHLTPGSVGGHVAVPRPHAGLGHDRIPWGARRRTPPRSRTPPPRPPRVLRPGRRRHISSRHPPPHTRSERFRLQKGPTFSVTDAKNENRRRLKYCPFFFFFFFFWAHTRKNGKCALYRLPLALCLLWFVLLCLYARVYLPIGSRSPVYLGHSTDGLG